MKTTNGNKFQEAFLTYMEKQIKRSRTTEEFEDNRAVMKAFIETSCGGSVDK